jgi:hypothetical protein
MRYTIAWSAIAFAGVHSSQMVAPQVTVQIPISIASRILATTMVIACHARFHKCTSFRMGQQLASQRISERKVAHSALSIARQVSRGAATTLALGHSCAGCRRNACSISAADIPVGVHLRFSRWAKSGAWERVFRHLAQTPTTNMQ